MNFKDFDDLLHSGINEIVLDSDIILEDGEESNYLKGIILDVDDLVVDGNGHSIDAKGKTRIFLCTGNAIIRNVTLKNGFAEDGGAIYNKGEITIEKSVFNKNTAKYGGAILNRGKIKISHCEFNNNTALPFNETGINGLHMGDGGAISNYSKLIIVESSFSNNSSNESGGAITNRGTLEISKSTFEGNTSKSYGGAIDSWVALSIKQSALRDNLSDNGGAINNFAGEVTLTQSTLQNNKAKSYGGAIRNDGTTTIEDCIINKNMAKKGGGAVFNYNRSLKILESTLDQNSSKFGGAINNRATVVLNDCEFNSNKSVKEGGVIYSNNNYYDQSSGTITKASIVCEGCDFSNNNSKSFGGVISTNFYIKCYECNFHDNISKKEGNIIYFNGIEDISLIMENSFIESNSVKRSDIYISNLSSALIKYTKIANRSDNYVIHNNGGILNISNLEFVCTDKQSIYNNNVIWISDENVEKLIKSSQGSVIKYKNQISDADNGFQYLDDLINANSQSIVLDCDIVMDETEQNYYEGGIELAHDNLILDGQNHVIDANYLSRIFIITGTDITLKNIKFKNGFYSQSEFDEFEQGGGAIYSLPNTSVNIENCEFVENNSRNIAGCINNKGVMNIHKSKFNDNSAQKSCGAIYNFNVLNLYDCNFKNNFAPLNEKSFKDNGYVETGGNIFNRGNMTFDNCNFNKTKLFMLTTFLKDDKLLDWFVAIAVISFWGMIISFFLQLTSISLFFFVVFLVCALLSSFIASYVGRRGFDYYG